MTRFAGEKVDLSTYMNSGTDFGRLGKLGQESRSLKKQAGWNAAANVASAGMDALGAVRAAKYGADATLAAGKAQAGATETAGMWNMFGSIGGGIMGGIGKNMKKSDWSKLSTSQKGAIAQNAGFNMGSRLASRL